MDKLYGSHLLNWSLIRRKADELMANQFYIMATQLKHLFHDWVGKIVSSEFYRKQIGRICWKSSIDSWEFLLKNNYNLYNTADLAEWSRALALMLQCIDGVSSNPTKRGQLCWVKFSDVYLYVIVY